MANEKPEPLEEQKLINPTPEELEKEHGTAQYGFSTDPTIKTALQLEQQRIYDATVIKG